MDFGHVGWMSCRLSPDVVDLGDVLDSTGEPSLTTWVWSGVGDRGDRGVLRLVLEPEEGDADRGFLSAIIIRVYRISVVTTRTPTLQSIGLGFPPAQALEVQAASLEEQP